MEGVSVLSYMGATLHLVLVISIVPLLTAAVMGLVIGLLQAVTQIQDQTLPQTVKMIAVLLVLTVFGAVLAEPLIRHTERLMQDFPAMTRERGVQR